MMNAISKLVGRKDAVASLEARLGELNAKAGSLLSEVERSQAALNEIEDEQAMLSAMAKVRTGQNTVRKLDLEIAQVRERLNQARNVARAARAEQLRAAFGTAAKDFLTQGEGVLAAAAKVMAAREALSIEGFRQELDAMPAPPLIGHTVALAPDLLTAFRQATDAALRPAPRVVAVTPAPAPTPKRQDPAPASRPARPGPSALGTFWAGDPNDGPVAVRRPALREAPSDDERLFLVHRGLIDHPRKGQLQAGDAIGLTEDEGRPLVRQGAGDWVSAEEMAAIDARSAEEEKAA